MMPIQPILLSDCVAHVESAGNPLAMRFEPDFNPTNAAIITVQSFATNGYMNKITARMIASTSWGRYQIMGANLWTQGYTGTILGYLSSNIAQRESFERFIQHIGFTDRPFKLMSPDAVLKFARLYNGSEVYAESLNRAYGDLING